MEKPVEEKYLTNLKQKILSYTKVDEEWLSHEMQYYKRIKLNKGDNLVSEGQLVEHFYYVAKGCIFYYKIEDGEKKP